MKRIKFNKTNFRNVLSLLIFSAFIHFAMSTIPGTDQQKSRLPDGRWEISKHYSSGDTETTVGNVDAQGRWDGPVKIEYENDNYMLTNTEEVNMVGGKRHGLSTVKYPNGYVTHFCYEHGERVEDKNCEKSAIIETEDLSAYGILSYEVPWFVIKLNALGFDTNYVKAYLDTIETLLYTTEFSEEDFGDYYSDVIDELEDTAFDSIIQLNAELSIYNGLDLILNNEFRLATLHSYGESDGNTYNVVKTIYPNYLLMLNEREVTETDFKEFCTDYDKIMSGFNPIALDDPFWVDSLDERMYRAIDSIYSRDEGSEIVAKSLKSAFISGKVRTISNLQQEYFSQIENRLIDKTPKDVAEVVLFSILEQFIYGNFLDNAVRDAYTIKKGIVTLATVTTNFSGNISSSSVSLSGNVIDDGGGVVTTRGIAWGTVYNPDTNNNTKPAGEGAGSFETVIDGLAEGETYYARTYATNSFGTAYGNCISFIAGNTVGLIGIETNDRDFNIYPNPASAETTLSFTVESSENVVVTIVNMNGQIMLKKDLGSLSLGENRVKLNISNLENGLYHCQLSNIVNVKASEKLLIAR